MGCHKGLQGCYIWDKGVITEMLQRCYRAHKCMATADRAVTVFVNEFQWDQRINNSKTVKFTITQNSFVFLKKISVITETKTQLFPINLKCH